MVHRRSDSDLDQDIQAHLDLLAVEHERRGLSPQAAREAARREFGGVEQVKEQYRDQRGWRWIEDLAGDVRYALRSLRRTPMVTMAAVITFALGIGANTAVFSVVDSVLLRPLTYVDPERLVAIHETVPRIGSVPVGPFEFEQWRASAQSFEQMALLAVAPVILTGAGDPQRLDAARVSASLFPLLGIEPALGRAFSPEEEVPGRHRVVVLSHTVWRTRFAADPAIVGRPVTLNDEPFVVIGVMPPGFRFPRLEQIFVLGIQGGQPQLWMPFAISDSERGENSFAALAKLRPAVSVDQARLELSAIQVEIGQRIPNAPQLGAAVVPLQEQITGPARDTLALLWAAIATLLLIACGNIANLLLARATARGPELAIRAALGASRRTLLRHSLVDTMTLATLGGACGVLAAFWSLPLLLRLAPASVARLDEVAVNGRALLFAAAITMTTGVVVGLLPARRAAGTRLSDSVKAGARSSTASRRDRRVRGLTVSMQVALTVGCLGAAGLVIQSLVNVLRVEPGFDSQQVLTIDVSLSPGRYADRDTRAAFAREVVERLAAVPGVSAVGVINKLPFQGVSMNSIVALEGTERDAIPLTERPQGDVRSVDAGYFGALRIPLLDGELFGDVEVNRPVAVVSTAMARRAWPGQNPIGKRFRLSAQPGRLVEVIGVVGDVRSMGLETSPSLAIYLPYRQMFLNGTSFVLRTTSDPGTVAGAARSAITAVDRSVPIDSVRTLDGVVSGSVASRRFQATLLMIFGVIAVMLAGVGVFGVMSYAVAQQSKELGIRLALGASPRSLQRLVVTNAVRLVGLGVAIGVPLAVGAGVAMRDVLFGVGPQDPTVLTTASVLIVLVSIAAGLIPARRASRIDPLVTLRAE